MKEQMKKYLPYILLIIFACVALGTTQIVVDQVNNPKKAVGASF